jgi:Sulfotransferase domain
MSDIVWLASYPKSGNTWMRAFLFNLFFNARKPMDINQIGGGDLITSESLLRWYEPLDPRPASTWTPEEVAAMRPRAQQAIADSVKGTIFCKTHATLTVVRNQPTINMAVTSGALIVVRNPLDIVLSLADFFGKPVDETIAIMATENFELPGDNVGVVETLGSWSQNVKSWTARPSPQLHVVRYEDLLDAPEKTFAGIVKFLGVQPTEERLETAIDNSSFKVLSAQEQKHGFAERSAHQRRFFRTGKAGGWREGLSTQQVDRIVAAHGEQMARFGYLPDAG